MFCSEVWLRRALMENFEDHVWAAWGASMGASKAIVLFAPRVLMDVWGSSAGFASVASTVGFAASALIAMAAPMESWSPAAKAAKKIVTFAFSCFVWPLCVEKCTAIGTLCCTMCGFTSCWRLCYWRQHPVQIYVRSLSASEMYAEPFPAVRHSKKAGLEMAVGQSLMSTYLGMMKSTQQ